MIVIPFPIERQSRLIRETAMQIDRRNGPLAERYWRAECNRLYARLQVQGFSEPIIRQQTERFALAVRAELHRHLGSAVHGNGGDAA